MKTQYETILRMCLNCFLTVIIEEAFGFLVICRRNEKSHKHVYYGRKQDKE